MRLNRTKRAFLKKEIKQIKSVICSFKYKYFCPVEELTPEAMKRFNEFRNDTLFKLVDQWKKMELELMGEDGQLYDKES